MTPAMNTAAIANSAHCVPKVTAKVPTCPTDWNHSRLVQTPARTPMAMITTTAVTAAGTRRRGQRGTVAGRRADRGWPGARKATPSPLLNLRLLNLRLLDLGPAAQASSSGRAGPA